MRTYRTVLEQKIRERQQTFEEFAQYVETFARENGEPGTLSFRHLQRLAAGRRSDGRPLGRVLPATARLLEHIFGLSIDDLLAPPTVEDWPDGQSAEIRRRLHLSSRVDSGVLDTLKGQLADIRRLDRQLGAVIAHDEVLAKVEQVGSLLAHSLSSGVREPLARLLSELSCLAGWQALDLGKVTESWRYYDQARMAALQSSVPHTWPLPKLDARLSSPMPASPRRPLASWKGFAPQRSRSALALFGRGWLPLTAKHWRQTVSTPKASALSIEQRNCCRPIPLTPTVHT
jgi:hypothetical protein